MSTAIVRMIPLALMAAGSLAFASRQLTPQECNSYPFKPAKDALTRADVVRELAELELVGYQPPTDNSSTDIRAYRERLIAKHATDCLHEHSTASNQETNR
ncbi:hypothetical protein OKW31_001555 [Paraburkholderia atlantica]|uniref:DUF4148 domain-containing protein n=1 Tax=Paraburkholderia atlantica TaxID=2654982 RepID=UPI003D21A62A